MTQPLSYDQLRRIVICRQLNSGFYIPMTFNDARYRLKARLMRGVEHGMRRGTYWAVHNRMPLSRPLKSEQLREVQLYQGWVPMWPTPNAGGSLWSRLRRRMDYGTIL